MRRFSALCTVAALYCITAGAQASAVGGSIMHIQQPDSLVQNISAARDSIPAETIAPVMKPDFKSSDTVARDNPRPDPRTRAERRACRARDFSFGLDSLVATRRARRNAICVDVEFRYRFDRRLYGHKTPNAMVHIVFSGIRRAKLRFRNSHIHCNGRGRPHATRPRNSHAIHRQHRQTSAGENTLRASPP